MSSAVMHPDDAKWLEERMGQTRCTLAFLEWCRQERFTPGLTVYHPPQNWTTGSATYIAWRHVG